MPNMQNSASRLLFKRWPLQWLPQSAPSYQGKNQFFRVQTETIEGPFKVSIDSFYSKPDHWFETPDEATADFLRVRAIAKIRAENILKEFEDLQSRLGFHVGFTYEGDTYGIYDDYQYIRFTEEKYHFTLKIENDWPKHS